MRKCHVCPQDYSYVIANPIGEGEVALCEDHYYHLERAKSSSYRDLIENKYFTRRGE
jgi:hypothetical protein